MLSVETTGLGNILSDVGLKLFSLADKLPSTVVSNMPFPCVPTRSLLDFICEVRNGVIYKPTGTSLSNFDGKNSQGQWIIGIRDFHNEDLGILNDYTLEICITTFILNAPSYDLSAIKFYPNPEYGGVILNQ